MKDRAGKLLSTVPGAGLALSQGWLGLFLLAKAMGLFTIKQHMRGHHKGLRDTVSIIPNRYKKFPRCIVK